MIDLPGLDRLLLINFCAELRNSQVVKKHNKKCVRISQDNVVPQFVI